MDEYQPIYSDSRALVIGIDTYVDGRFRPLDNAELDANQVADVLARSPYNFRVERLMGTDATKDAIVAALAALHDSLPNDRIVVYFSGHGDTLVDNFEDKVGYLAATDTFKDKPHTQLLLTEVTDLRRFTKAKHIAFIFDACYSADVLGVIAHKGPSNTSADKFLMRSAYLALSAGAGLVDDYRSMTQSLLKVLQDDWTNSQTGLCTFSDLAMEVKSEIVALTSKSQIPQFGTLDKSQDGDIVFRFSKIKPDTKAHRIHPLGEETDAHSRVTKQGRAPKPVSTWQRVGTVAAIIAAILVVSGLVLMSSGAIRLPGATQTVTGPGGSTDFPTQIPAFFPLATTGPGAVDESHFALPVVFGSCPDGVGRKALQDKYAMVVWVTNEQDTASAPIGCFGTTPFRFLDINMLDSNLTVRPDVGYVVPLSAQNEANVESAEEFLKSYLDDAFHVALGSSLETSHSQDSPWNPGYYDQFTANLVQLIGSSNSSTDHCNDSAYPDEVLASPGPTQGQLTIALVVDVRCATGPSRYSKPFVVQGVVTNESGAMKLARSICVQELERHALLRAENSQGQLNKTQCFTVIPS